jgi:hypothetical protein
MAGGRERSQGGMGFQIATMGRVPADRRRRHADLEAACRTIDPLQYPACPEAIGIR